MADLAASPAHCLLVRADPMKALGAYTLSARERARIVSVVRQPGMAVNCTIHRTTRLVPLDTLLPLTCAALGKALGAEVEAYWSVATRPAIRFETEAARFVAHLETRLADAGNAWPWPAAALADLARLELAIETLRVAPRIVDQAPRGPTAAPVHHRLHPAARVVALGHEPRALLAGARAAPPDLANVPRGSYLIVLTSEAGKLDIFVAPPERVGDVEALTRAGIAAAWLIEAGLAVADGGAGDSP